MLRESPIFQGALLDSHKGGAGKLRLGGAAFAELGHCSQFRPIFARSIDAARESAHLGRPCTRKELSPRAPWFVRIGRSASSLPHRPPHKSHQKWPAVAAARRFSANSSTRRHRIRWSETRSPPIFGSQPQAKFNFYKVKMLRFLLYGLKYNLKLCNTIPIFTKIISNH